MHGFSYHPSLAITEGRHNEPAPKKDPTKKLECELVFESAHVLESGGRTAIMFTMLDPETGKRYLAQTSHTILDGLLGAVRGMEARWAEQPVDNIWNKG